MSSKANPNKLVFADIDAPDQVWTFDAKQVEITGGQLGGIVVTNGSLRLSDELALGQVVIAMPTSGKGEPDNGLYLGGATGRISAVCTLGTQRDHGKIGQGTHDLQIGVWYGRCIPPAATLAGSEPVHRDGIQVMSAERVSIGRIDIINQYPGATNGGLWLNPNKQDSSGVDQNDPTLIQDVVVEGGSIVFPNAGIHLGACTRCGARATLLAATRPMRIDAKAIDPVDVDNTKLVLE
jgi:hypothetical protein